MIIGDMPSADQTAGGTYDSPWFPPGGHLVALSCQLVIAKHTGSPAVEVQAILDQGDDSAMELLPGRPESVALNQGSITTPSPVPTSAQATSSSLLSNNLHKETS